MLIWFRETGSVQKSFIVGGKEFTNFEELAKFIQDLKSTKILEFTKLREKIKENENPSDDLWMK